MGTSPEPVKITVVAPGAPVARRLLREYLEDIVGRYHGRPATGEEIETEVRAAGGDDLALPRGLLLVAERDGDPLGCAGLRLLPDGVGEVTRVFVVPGARGEGVGARLMGELERVACGHGRSVLRLDTRRDLVEARRLYARLGYREVPPFAEGPYRDHSFSKSLD